MRSRILALTAALTVCAVDAFPQDAAPARRPAQREPAKTARPAQEAPATRQAPMDDAARREAARRQAARRQAAEGTAAAPAAGRDMTQELVRAERTHMDRIARLRRLRVLAQQQGQEDRLEALVALERKQQEVHTRTLDRLRNAMGDEAFERTRMRLERASKTRTGGLQGPIRDASGRRGALDAREGPGLERGPAGKDATRKGDGAPARSGG